MGKSRTHEILDELDNEMFSRRGKASLTSLRSGSTPATKASQDIGDRREAYKGEVKPEGGGEQHSPPGTEGIKSQHDESGHTESRGYDGKIGEEHSGAPHFTDGEHEGHGDRWGMNNNPRVAGEGPTGAAHDSDRSSEHDGAGHPRGAANFKHLAGMPGQERADEKCKHCGK